MTHPRRRFARSQPPESAGARAVQADLRRLGRQSRPPLCGWAPPADRQSRIRGSRSLESGSRVTGGATRRLRAVNAPIPSTPPRTEPVALAPGATRLPTRRTPCAPSVPASPPPPPSPACRLTYAPAAQALAFHVLRQLGPRRGLCAGSWPSAPRRPPMRCCARRWRWPWAKEGALRAAFTLVDQAVEAAKRSPQRAQAFINACLRRFLRERDAWCGHRHRPGGALEPSALVDRAPAAGPSAALAADPGRQQPAAAHDAARERARVHPPRRLPSAWPRPASTPRPARRPGLHAGASRGRCKPSPASRKAWCRCRTPAPSWPRPAAGAGAAAPAPACWTPAPRPAARRRTCWSWPMPRCSPWTSTRALRAHPRDAGAAGPAGQVLAADAAQPAAGGTASPSTPSCSMRPAPPPASCGGTPTCAGCAARATSPSWRRSRSGCWHALWPLLRPGGRLLYCTCSVFRAEGERQIEAFLAHNTAAVLRPAPRPFMPERNGRGAEAHMP